MRIFITRLTWNGIGYVENTLTTPVILLYFSGLCAAVLLPAFLLIKRAGPGLSRGELSTAMWFVLCGYIHLVVEVSLDMFRASTRYLRH